MSSSFDACWACGRIVTWGVCEGPHPDLDMKKAVIRGWVTRSVTGPYRRFAEDPIVVKVSESKPYRPIAQIPWTEIREEVNVPPPAPVREIVLSKEERRVGRPMQPRCPECEYPITRDPIADWCERCLWVRGEERVPVREQRRASA